MDKKFKKYFIIVSLSTFAFMVCLLGSVILFPKVAALIITFACLFFIGVLAEFVLCVFFVKDYLERHKNEF